MAKLFELNEQGDIDLNKEWIKLNPIFSIILTRDKGSQGDPYGKNKLQARRDFNYIRMMWEPDSEYESFPESKRRSHILSVLKIHSNTYDADLELQAAEEEYKNFLKNIRSWRAWKAASNSLDNKIAWLEEYQAGAVDKQGKILLEPEKHSKAIKAIKDDMVVIEDMKTVLDKELLQEIQTRQTLKKGLREDRVMEVQEANYFK